MIPVHSLVNAGAFELAIHSWDIRSALEPSAHLSPEALAAMLDFFSDARIGSFSLTPGYRPYPVSVCVHRSAQQSVGYCGGR